LVGHLLRVFGRRVDEQQQTDDEGDDQRDH
jgi:hypothetical protein